MPFLLDLQFLWFPSPYEVRVSIECNFQCFTWCWRHTLNFVMWKPISSLLQLPTLLIQWLKRWQKGPCGWQSSSVAILEVESVHMRWSVFIGARNVPIGVTVARPSHPAVAWGPGEPPVHHLCQPGSTPPTPCSEDSRAVITGAYRWSITKPALRRHNFIFYVRSRGSLLLCY